MPISAVTPPRRQLVLSGLAALLGVAGGLVGWAFLRMTALLLNLTLRHRVGWQFPPLAHVRLGGWFVLITLGGGAVVAVLARYEPMIRGHGIPEAMEAVLVHQSRIPWRAALTKPVASIIAIGTGAPFGAEGPIILTGGALGSLLGQFVRVSPSERKVLLASGSAAGMAAIFGAPIGAVLLAIELLLFEFSPRVLVPLVVAAVFADGVHILLIGQGPLFRVPAGDFAGLQSLPLYVVLGIVCALLGIVVTTGAFGLEDVFALLPIRRFWHPVIGAAVVAAIGLVVPRALGVGYDVIGDSLAGRLSIGMLAAVCLAKLVAWCVAIGSGTSGSSLAPILLIGASGGGLVGAGAHHLFPTASVSTEAFALVGMAATFAAAAGAPFTSIVLVFEVTRDYNIILPLMFATVIAHLIARTVLPDTLMTEKLTRRGIRVSDRYQVDLLRLTTVDQVMANSVAAVDAHDTVGDLRRRFATSGRHAYPVTRAGICVGIVTEGDVFQRHRYDSVAVIEIATTEVVTVKPSDSVFDAARTLLHEGVRQLPVVDNQVLVGVFSRLDALRVAELQAEHEVVQSGWLRSRRGTRHLPSG